MLGQTGRAREAVSALAQMARLGEPACTQPVLSQHTGCLCLCSFCCLPVKLDRLSRILCVEQVCNQIHRLAQPSCMHVCAAARWTWHRVCSMSCLVSTPHAVLLGLAARTIVLPTDC